MHGSGSVRVFGGASDCELAWLISIDEPNIANARTCVKGINPSENAHGAAVDALSDGFLGECGELEDQGGGVLVADRLLPRGAT